MNATRTTDQRFRIGTVARLTGISPDTLRVWERRYEVVAPMRAAGGGREYTSEDVERLQLIKQLVDGGHAIGSIARLDTGSLITRSMQTFSSAAATEKLPHRPCRIIVVGATLAGRLKAGADAMSGIELLVASPNIESCLSDRPHQPADVLVIEIPTVHVDTTRQILAWLDDIGAQKALVVYRFAATDALQQLPAARVQTVRAPVTPVVVRNLCLGMRTLAGAEYTGGGQVGVNLSIAPRRYSNEALVKLGLVSTTVKCECPKHLTELITDLVAFERYSTECENRNLEDAALHAYLNATASHARTLIEDALTHVIEVEGIKLDE